ncbi:MAG TPA: hypothetical protein VMV72_11425 [Verrucomicrobiae bacterium]|nr:hypothetical protein [Verrucomicrobiae bacterium]
MSDAIQHEPSAEPRRWWLPSVSTMIWLVFFLAIIFSPNRAMLVASDSDPCWHWQQGNWMLEHHAVLRTEIFSHTRPGAPLVDLWWLSEIVTAVAGNLLGWNGIVLVTAALCATSVWLLHRQLLAEENEIVLSTVLTLLAASACAIHWLARPHLATILLFIAFAGQLRWFARGRTTAGKLMVLLPVLTALWANLHGAFVFAFVLIGVYWLGAVVSWMIAPQDRRPGFRHQVALLTGLGLACLLASLVSPNGWRLPLQVFHYTRSPLLMGLAVEYLPPNFHDPGNLPLLLIFALVLSVLAVAWPRLTATDGLLLVVWAVLALRMARNGPLFALAATPILAEHWNAYLRAASPSRAMQRYRALSAGLTSANRMAGARGLPALAVLAIALVMAKPQLLGGRPLLATELPPQRFPVAAVEFLHRSPDAVHGEMFNEYTWGGYLIWALPERKVFIHPNLDVYGEGLVREFVEVNEATNDWEGILKKYNVGWTILPTDHRLSRLLAKRADWKLVYADSVAAIYGRTP